MAALNSAIAAIEKQWGKGAILPPGAGSLPGVEFIPTGCESLNRILGGGYARGRIVELFGEPSSGKSTLAMHAVAEAQAMGGNAALIDAEHATDPVYISNLGVDLDKLIVCQPDHGEQALGIAETLVQSGALDVIVIDSVEQPEFAGEFQVYANPTLLVFFEGKEYIRKSKFVAIPELKAEISRLYEMMFS